MTIGVACFGDGASAAAREVVLGAEVVGHGSIGGFAVFAFCDALGRVRHATTQRGGVTALTLPAGWREARAAAIISSGPDRPEPLIQFLPGADGVGLVTGHRLPNAPGGDGAPLNLAALKLLAAGATPHEAANAPLALAPEADAGLIALSVDGGVGLANSRRVARRSDLGVAMGRADARGFALMLNSIHGPFPNATHLAEALGDLALGVLEGAPRGHAMLRLDRTARVKVCDNDRVHVDGAGLILAIETTNPALRTTVAARRTVIYLDAPVWRDGALIGSCLTEAFAAVDDGLVIPFPTEPERRVLMRYV